jgi:hypothetical protein
VHELNDGCFWKIIVPNYNLGSFGGTAPKSNSVFIFKFQLMFADVAEDVASDMDTHPDLFVPENPIWTVVGEQSLMLQCAGSGVQEYYPVWGILLPPD